LETLFETIYDNVCVKGESSSRDALTSNIQQQVFHRNGGTHWNGWNALVLIINILVFLWFIATEHYISWLSTL